LAIDFGFKQFKNVVKKDTGGFSWFRNGNERDVDRLKDTFQMNRGCKFRRIQRTSNEDDGPKMHEQVLATLGNANDLKKLFSQGKYYKSSSIRYFISIVCKDVTEDPVAGTSQEGYKGKAKRR